VRIGYPFAVSKYPVTVAEYARFVEDTARDTRGQCQAFTPNGKWDYFDCDWRRPGFPQADDNPVVVVSWEDAMAYAAWLSLKTGRRYRLLSEAEYEYVARAGSTTAYWWGDDPAQACRFANGADLDAKAEPRFSDWTVNSCHDGSPATAPVNAFTPNPFGLYQIVGNTWSFTRDCWAPDYSGAPADGSARIVQDCRTPVVRGGSWADTPDNLRSASRGRNIYYIRFAVNGFRVARDL
jgi:formylglycine-generating enzyme required for sulfatase activity